MTAESSLFIAGEEDAVIEDVIVENLNLTLKQQGTQNQEFLMSSLPRETCIRMRYRQSISDQPKEWKFREILDVMGFIRNIRLVRQKRQKI